MFNQGGGPSSDQAAPSSSARADLPALEVETPPVTGAADRLCPSVIGNLPLTLDDAQARPVRSASPYAVAWGDPPIVLRCGVPRPAELADDSSLLEVNGISWFVQPAGDETLWTAVDREVYVDVRVPSSRASGPVALLSGTIGEQLPLVSAPGGAATPTR